MMNQTPHAQLELSMSGMLHNYRYFRSKLKPETKLLILVKANSYGHGSVEFAKQMEAAGADYFGVATPWEGIELKQNGIEKPILVLTTGTESYPEIIRYGLEPGMPTVEALTLFVQELRKEGIKEYPVHIKLDTGMHRLGFMEKELPALKEFLAKTPEIKVKSIYSHLAAADEPQHDEFTRGQIALYKKMSGDLIESLGYKPIRHILNSAGIERFTENQMDMVRLGVGIYGIGSVPGQDLKPAAFYRCPIVQIKELVPEDGTVGYGRHGKIDKPKRTATICVGYADGINRHLGRGNASFEVRGQMAPTIGNICMDMCMLDITGIEGVEVGDTVTIFGEKPHANDLAAILDTIPYEIFTSVPRRVKKVLVD